MVGKLGNSVDTLDEPSRPDLTSPSFPCDIPPTEHSMTNRTLFTTTLLAAAIALAGCKPSTDAAAPGDAATPPTTVARSEERRGGKAGVSKCSSRWSPLNSKQTPTTLLKTPYPPTQQEYH